MDRIDIIKNELAYGVIDKYNSPFLCFISNFIESYNGYNLSVDCYREYKIDLHKYVLMDGEIESYLYVIADILGYKDMVITIEQESIYECRKELTNLLKSLYKYVTSPSGYDYYFISYNFTVWDSHCLGIAARARNFLIDNILSEL